MVAQVAQRYAINANLIFTWLRDPRYAPKPLEEAAAACFLPVEIVDRPVHEDSREAVEAQPASCVIVIEIAGGHRLRIAGGYDPETLARLILGCPDDPRLSPTQLRIYLMFHLD